MLRILFFLGLLATILVYSVDAGVLNSARAHNVDAMLRNPVVVQRQIRCLQCKGPCDKIGEELKVVIPQVAATQCRSCSANERANMGKIINHVQNQYPKEWAELNASMRAGVRCPSFN